MWWLSYDVQTLRTGAQRSPDHCRVYEQLFARARTCIGHWKYQWRQKCHHLCSSKTFTTTWEAHRAKKARPDGKEWRDPLLSLSFRVYSIWKTPLITFWKMPSMTTRSVLLSSINSAWRVIVHRLDIQKTNQFRLWTFHQFKSTKSRISLPVYRW